MSNPNKDPIARKGKIAASTAVLSTMGALLIFGGKNHNTAPDSGQPQQRDPKNPVEHTGQATRAKEHHPSPVYMSEKGPDGKVDFYAHKITQHGIETNLGNDGTMAPNPDRHHQPNPNVSIIGPVHVGAPVEKPDWAK